MRRGEVGKKTHKKEIDNPSIFMTSLADFLSDFLHILKINLNNLNQNEKFGDFNDGMAL